MIRKLKINKDIYGHTLDFFKKRIVEVCGLILISIFGVFSYSLFNYSPKNQTLIYRADEHSTSGFFEIYSNISADFFLQSFGLISFLIDTKIIFFFELMSKSSIFFLISLVFIKSEMKEYSPFERCFFKPIILNFSSINRTTFEELLFKLLFLYIIFTDINFKYTLYEMDAI